MSGFLPWSETSTHLSNYCDILRIFGYSEKEMFNMVKGAIARHEEMQREVDAGSRDLLYRTRLEIKSAKDL